MKVSIRWIFDHIESHWDSIDISHLVKLFNGKTAEIEHVERVAIDLSNFTLVRVTNADATKVMGFSSELNTEIELLPRTDIQVDAYYIATKENDVYRWTTLVDVASAKDGLLPEISLSNADANSWKGSFEAEDVILHVDNKSITHRPDLWGHRGFAREIAALLDLTLKEEKDFFAEKETAQHTVESKPSEDNPFQVAIKDTERCSRFGSLYFNTIAFRPSSLWMAHRLARIDARPINCLVDMTNYVMFDISQPLHAYDAEKMSTSTVQVQRADTGQRLELLDDQVIELTNQDLIISDGEKPLALAGIMGGKHSGINAQTKAIFLESAHFDATSTRRTAVRFKVRSEASARFEKTLDPNQNILGIKRFLQLLHAEGVSYTCAKDIISLGEAISPITLTISHEYIEQRIGTEIDADFIIKTLESIEFGVQQQGSEYIVTVPTFRAAKDVGIKEDIVEEIARFYGYSSIPAQLPEKQTKSHSLDHVNRMRSIKQICAYAMVMREVYNYAFFDETFLAQLNWRPKKSISVKNPVSERYRQLATTLTPGLLSCLQANSLQEKMRFFEWGRIWKEEEHMHEQAALAGVFFDKKHVDFYESKQELSKLFNFFDMHVEWEKVDSTEFPWYMPYQTAQLLVDGEIIGLAGKANKAFLDTIVEGDVFLFELNGDALLSYVRPQQRYQAPSKYPAVERDISMLVPLRLTVRHVISAIRGANESICGIRLLDMFDKEEWEGKRSLTFRFNIQATDRTFTKEEADTIWQKVVHAVKDLGAAVR